MLVPPLRALALEHKGAASWTRSFELEQARRREKGPLRHDPCGDGWIEHFMRRRYVEATKELKEELTRRKEAIGCSGGTFNLGGLDEDVVGRLSEARRVFWVHRS